MSDAGILQMDKAEPLGQNVLGLSEKAVKTHIWTAICTYLMVAYLIRQLKSGLSIYEMIQIPGISTLDKTPVNQILTRPKTMSKKNITYLISMIYKCDSANF